MGNNVFNELTINDFHYKELTLMSVIFFFE